MATNITYVTSNPCMTFLMYNKFMTSLVLLVTKVTCIWTFWSMWHHVFLQLAHCWAHLLTNRAMKFFWRCMQGHVDIQCILIFVYLFAQWTGESLSSKLICIPWSQTVNILYNYSGIHGVFFLYRSAVRHSYKNDILGSPPRKKTDILRLCYSTDIHYVKFFNHWSV